MKPLPGSPKYYQTRLDVLRIFRLNDPFYALRLFGCLNIFYCFFTLPLHISIFQLYLTLFYRSRPIIACEWNKWHFLLFTSAFHTVVYMFGTEEGLTTLVLSWSFRKGMIEVQIFHGILFEDAQKHCKNVGSQKLRW